MALIDPDEAARRVRAARAYAGLTRAQLAAKLPLTAKQIKDIEVGGRPSTSREDLRAIARACQVPPDFLLVGWLGRQRLEESIREALQVLLSGPIGSLRELEQLAREYEIDLSEPVAPEPQPVEPAPAPSDDDARPAAADPSPAR